MRDAFGGIVNITMIVVFLVVVSGYLAFNVTYTKAFRMKNKIITTLEQYEGCEGDNRNACETILDGYARDLGYNTDTPTIDNSNSKDTYCSNKGYCWAKYPAGSSENTKYYYKVSTKIYIEIPIIDKIMSGMNVFTLTGNTKLIRVNS